MTNVVPLFSVYQCTTLNSVTCSLRKVDCICNGGVATIEVYED